MAPGIEAHVHQHIFGYRFDMAVDGMRNAVREVNFAAEDLHPRKRYGNAIRITKTELKSELQAQRDIDLRAQRYWEIYNPETLNALGQPTAYKLVPGVNAFPYQHPDSPVGRRAGFIYHHFWATQFAEGEMYPAGQYPNQHKGGDGLPQWTRAGRSLDN